MYRYASFNRSSRSIKKHLTQKSHPSFRPSVNPSACNLLKVIETYFSDFSDWQGIQSEWSKQKFVA